MINKQKLRITAIAAAVLTLTVGASAAQAAPQFQVKEPATAAPAAVQGTSRIIVKYRTDSAAARDRSAKLSVVQSALSRSGLGAGKARAAAIRAEHVRTLGVGADLIRLDAKLNRAELDKVVAELAADPAVLYAEADVKLQRIDSPAPKEQPQLVPNDQYYQTYQWHLHNAAGGINAPAAWDIAQGEGVVVAVLDTGILPGHPDFSGNLLQGYDFISDAATSRRPTSDRVPGALDYGDWAAANECDAGSPAENSSWHGTHVSGTIAEATNNGVGMAGVAYKSQVLPVRVLGKCGGYLSDIADAIIWASGGSVAGIPANANPAEIINMSLGGNGACGTVYQDAINGAVSRGTTVVVAAGNSGANAGNYRPASCSNVVSVGATRITGGIASYSNYGAVVDLSGPGGGGNVDGNPGGYVWQAWYSGTTTPTSGAYSYVGMSGTSMASPHVAAVAALVQGALAAASRDILSPSEMEALLKQTARPFPVTIPASTPIGSGIVDAKAALDKALVPPCDPAVDTCGPVATPLTNKVVVSGLAGATGSEALYSFEAQAGAVLSILTYGGTGNVSLYVSEGEEPTSTVFDAKSARAGNSETVRFTAPAAGTYYIKLVGASAYSGVSLVARQ